jgi:hypothetical protein
LGAKYLFKIEELLKIIYNDLTNCYLFFTEPIPIKNPYNNLPFGKSILYFIYFNIIESFKISFIKNHYLDLFLKFAECNFNLTKFVNIYEHILRELSIKNFLNNTNKSKLRIEINNMIDKFNSYQNNKNKIQIDEEFPDELLIKIMKPYLHLYFEYKYSLVPILKNESINKLYRKLNEFHKFNPIFGRRKIIMKNILFKKKFKRVKSHIEYNSKHKKFNVYDNDTFMNNHLSYKYNHDNYTNYIDTNILVSSINRPIGVYIQQFIDDNDNSSEINEENEDNESSEENEENEEYNVVWEDEDNESSEENEENEENEEYNVVWEDEDSIS